MLDDLAFGARFVSFHNFDRFEAHTEPSNPGLLIWPGGALAEERTDRYGLEYPGLYRDDIDRPDLADMMQQAIATDAALSIILPTARYVGKEEVLRSDISNLMSDLLSGKYGVLPNNLILQVGSEYYGHFEDGARTAAQQYATIAQTMVEEIVSGLGDLSVNIAGADFKIAVQMGRSHVDDVQIRAGLNDFVFDNVDLLIHHRFPAEAQGIDRQMDIVLANKAAWKAAIETAGGDGGDLFVSAWNVAQITREDALDEYLSINRDLSREDVDLENRTTTEFERYWQDRLQDFSYGEEHPRLLLETFASYAEAGASAGAVYGFDVMHPGRLSWRSPDGEDHIFVGGKMVEMIYESLKGTRALQSTKDFERGDNLTAYGFEGDDRLVIFLAAGGDAPGKVALDVAGIGEDLISLWADRLEVGSNPDWMQEFDVPDNPEIDESPEAATYAPGVRSAADVDIEGATLSVMMGAFDVVRLVFAKTEDAADELSVISMDDEIDLMDYTPDDFGEIDEVPVGEVPEEEVEAPPEDGGGFEGGILAALLLPLLFLLGG
ncbi:hypothetical protein ACRDNQ_05895 [Palleronia sp. KMU-117]|uniref:hypothetical protein n=1 Tax=Palleronia sp. KMU-117 TaxID=3434108 RepID=UPI003D727175